jgi:DNA repair exonuclease SbcCD nuclease subunit
MRLVHFSDIHLAAWTRDLSALFDKRVLGLLNYAVRRRHHMHEDYVERAVQRIPELNPDWVICTGDVTCVGSPEEFARARDALAPLVANEAFEFFYIPGNHDAYVRNRRCRKSLETSFHYLNRERWRLSELPCEVNCGQIRLWLVDECQPTIITASSGRLLPQTREWLQARFVDERQKNETRILAGHFPSRRADGSKLPRRRRLSGNELIHHALTAGQLDVSLCGHIHDQFMHREDNGGLEVCVGSLTVNANLNVIDIDPETGRFNQRWERL